MWIYEIPKEPGYYWLYGKVWKSKTNEWYYVEIGKSFIITSGNFLYKSDIEYGIWIKVVYPDLPGDVK